MRNNIKGDLDMHRSSSMPAQPKPIENNPLKRSIEKESVYEDNCTGTRLLNDQREKFESLAWSNFEAHSELNFSNEHNWCSSSIELDTNSKKDIIDWDPLRHRTNRVISKGGRENVLYRHVPEKPWRYIRDFVTTLIELEWKYMLAIFISSYFLSWFFFAVLCYVVAYSHGDVLFDEITGERLNEGKEPCIKGIKDFLTIFIYSIETQTTIGFGEKYPTEECPETIFLFIMQIICSIAIEGGMISIIYVKTARPAKQLAKLKFSDKAVICYRDGALYLMFRVCDPREQQIIDSKVRLYMIVDEITREGEINKSYKELQLQSNGRQIIVWPEIICHAIDELSPLYQYTNAKEFNVAEFELFVSIVGTSAVTAQVTEARTSYMPREIFWGQRFVNIIFYDVLNGRYIVDYENFNTTISVDMHGHKSQFSN